MTVEQDETREYVAAITTELATMAQQAGLPFLTYLLRLAQTEALERRTTIQRDAKARSTAALTKRSQMRKGDVGRHVAG